MEFGTLNKFSIENTFMEDADTWLIFFTFTNIKNSTCLTSHYFFSNKDPDKNAIQRNIFVDVTIMTTYHSKFN